MMVIYSNTVAPKASVSSVVLIATTFIQVPRSAGLDSRHSGHQVLEFINPPSTTQEELITDISCWNENLSTLVSVQIFFFQTNWIFLLCVVMRSVCKMLSGLWKSPGKSGGLRNTSKVSSESSLLILLLPALPLDTGATLFLLLQSCPAWYSRHVFQSAYVCVTVSCMHMNSDT